MTAAWLTLDAQDNEPSTFWTYVIAALETAVPNVVASALSLLESPQPRTEFPLRALLNDLADLPSDVVLVLDDYHAIDRPEVHDGVAFILDQLPPLMHMVITTRADPPLPLSRMRASGELVEIRAADLRFTPDEAAAYLNGTMGLELAGADIAALEARTEGWIAALQLAALSMRGRSDMTSFIASFAGEDRYVVDYLVDEVLARQSEDIRNFLMKTAVLDRMSGPLCDAVTGRNDGRAMVEVLERANLFLVALDDRRRWYRYHQLFADVLRARLLDEQSDEVPELHRRASDWFERNGERSEAISHAMAARDFARAAELIELAIPEIRKARREMTLRSWLDAIPGDLVRARPVLSVGYVGALMSTGEFGRVEELLQSAEQWLETPASDRSSAGMVVADAAEFDRLPGAIALYRTAQARVSGDVPATMDHARRALELVDEGDHLGRGGAAAFLGLAYWTTGDLDAAYRWFADGMASLGRAGHLSDVVGGAVTQADIQIAQGRLTEALATLERGLTLATGSGGTVLRGATDMHVGISEILRERNDLAGATRHLEAARRLGDQNGFPQSPYRARVVMARIHQAEGDPAGALRLLDEAESVYVAEFSPNVRPITALKARVWIAKGELSRAWAWARAHDISTAGTLAYVHEFEHATLARLLLAQGNHDASQETIREAIQLTERLLAAADDLGRNGSLIDVLVVQALARHAGGDVAGAIARLDRAVALAEPDGHVRVLLDEGQPMAALLKLAAKRRTAPDYLRRLLAEAIPAHGRPIARQRLIEPLSDRELDVLRLLGTDLDGPDIARELVVALSTVRTHTKSIYSKLGVNSRRAAVRRAEELDLLARTDNNHPRRIEADRA